MEDLKKSTFEKYDAFTVGEVFNMKPDELPEFIGETGHFSTIFDFSAHTPVSYTHLVRILHKKQERATKNGGIKMKFQKLGNTDIDVSVVALGT